VKVAPVCYAKNVCASRNKQGKQLNDWTLIRGYDGVLRERASRMRGEGKSCDVRVLIMVRRATADCCEKWVDNTSTSDLTETAPSPP
jgi:hypothetical protein